VRLMRRGPLDDGVRFGHARAASSLEPVSGSTQ
jgi:hypothetical protein